MPFVRVLLPLVAALALLGQSVSTFAAAGPRAELKCCCPDPDACKCHDHEGGRDHEPQMTRCGADGEMVVPIVPAAVLPSALVADGRHATPVTWPEPAPMPGSRPIELETPPF